MTPELEHLKAVIEGKPGLPQWKKWFAAHEQALESQFTRGRALRIKHHPMTEIPKLLGERGIEFVQSDYYEWIDDAPGRCRDCGAIIESSGGTVSCPNGCFVAHATFSMHVFERQTELIQRVKEAYTAKERRYINKEIIKAACLHSFDETFLNTVGLPCVEATGISFNLAPPMPTLREYLKGKREYSSRWPKYVRCLNEKDGAIIGVDQSAPPPQYYAVVSVDLNEPTHEVHYINSDVQAFIGFLAECRLHLRRSRAGLQRYEDSFQDSLRWMTRMDARAVNEGWWQAVFKSMHHNRLPLSKAHG